MKSNKKRRKLRNYFFVNKAQVTIFVSNLILLVIIFAIILLAVLSPFYSDIFKSEDIYLQNLSSKLFIVLMERCAIAFFIILIPLFIQQVLVIHKICGPFVSFKRVLDKLSEGDFSKKVYLRRYDFFSTEADQINGVLDKVSSVMTAVSEHQNTIVRELEKVSPFSEQSKEVEGVLHSIKNQAQASIDELTTIKVNSG